MGDALEALRIVAILASPAVPDTAQAIWERIGLPGLVADQRLPDAAAWGGYTRRRRGHQGRRPVPPPVMVWTDSHCHLHDTRIPDGTDAAVAAAAAAGVTTLITVGCDRETSLAAIAVAADHPHVRATVGLHPHDAVQGVDTIVDLLDTPGIVAVGEAGLDYYYDHSPREVQRQRVFAEQIQLANDQRPRARDPHPRRVGRHVRHARRRRRAGAHGLPLLHRRPRRGPPCLDIGATLSFSGIVTFKGAPDVQAAAAMCPLDRMLVETDSPYLAPIPHRGQPNQPAWVPHVGQFIADLRTCPWATSHEPPPTTPRSSSRSAERPRRPPDGPTQPTCDHSPWSCRLRIVNHRARGTMTAPHPEGRACGQLAGSTSNHGTHPTRPTPHPAGECADARGDAGALVGQPVDRRRTSPRPASLSSTSRDSDNGATPRPAIRRAATSHRYSSTARPGRSAPDSPRSPFPHLLRSPASRPPPRFGAPSERARRA